MESKAKSNKIQKEQLQLVKIQSELEGIVDKINDTINALKVEELQLKSNAVAAMNIQPLLSDAEDLPSTSASALLKVEPSSPVKEEPLESPVNEQDIDLDMFLRNEEEEEEEEAMLVEKEEGEEEDDD